MNTLLLAALPAAALASFPPTTEDPDLTRAGLSPVDAACIGGALDAARTTETRRQYNPVWGPWQRWFAVFLLSVATMAPASPPLTSHGWLHFIVRAASPWRDSSEGMAA